MGVKWLLKWVANEGGSVSTDVPDAILSQLEQLNPGGDSQQQVAQGTKWFNQCQFMKQGQDDVLGTGSPTEDVVVVQLGELEAQRFLVARSERIVLEAEETISDILGKMDFQPVSASHIRFEGTRHILGDFVVKVGSVTQNEDFKGVMVEVEYCPLSFLPAAKVIMCEFCNILKTITSTIAEGRLEDVGAQLLQYSLSSNFSNVHSAVQYATLADTYIKGGA